MDKRPLDPENVSFDDCVHGIFRDDPEQSNTVNNSSSMSGDPYFDIFDWHPAYQSCQRYFLDHAQFDGGVRAVAALVNIQLPFQWSKPVMNSSPSSPQIPRPAFSSWPHHGQNPSSPRGQPPTWVSLVPYVRRLIVTGFDKEAILHGFFGDDWRKGIAPLQDTERRNYLFAAKSGGWGGVKAQYDMSPYETVPFLKPLQNTQLMEIEGAEKAWSQWLAMEDWMVGPRSPEGMEGAQSNAPHAHSHSHPHAHSHSTTR